MNNVATFYRFTPLQDVESLRSRLHGLAAELSLKGTIVLAPEGINAALCGSRQRLEELLGVLRREAPFQELPVQYLPAASGNPVFGRLKVRVKPEIISFGQPDSHPAQRTGAPVDVGVWHRLLDDPAVTVVDVRNQYETVLGGFPGSLNPGTSNFREFAAFAQKALDPAEHRCVAMYCTGGIRCEKASAYLLRRGFENVAQLEGGILGYLGAVPEGESRWQGLCFVFDERLAVDGQLRAAEACLPEGP